MASQEDSGGSSMLKVKQLLKSVGRSLSGLKTLAPKQSSKPKPEQQQVIVPQELQQHLDMYLKTDSLLAALSADTSSLDLSTESVADSRASFMSNLSNLTESRSHPIAENSTKILEVMEEMENLKKQLDGGLVEFARAISRIQQRHSPTILAKSAGLESAREAVEVALVKQKQGADGDSEKTAKRQQKLLARRKAYEEKLREMFIEVPQAEVEVEVSFCKEFLQMMRQQKKLVFETFSLFESLEEPLQQLDQYCEECMRQLKDSQKIELQDNEKRIIRVCGPRIVEMLSAPNFAVAMSIGEVASSPVKMEEGDAPVRALLRLMDDADLSTPFLKLNISNELPRSAVESTLFRTPSMAGYLCVTAMRMTSQKYLKVCLGPLVEQICSGDADFEIHEKHLSAEESLETNTDNLCKAIQWFFDTITHSSSGLPSLLRTIAIHVFHISGDKHRDVARHVISGLLYVAFLCPVIRRPQDFALLPADPDERSARTLEIIAEAFRCIADNEAIPESFPASAALNQVLDQNRQKLSQVVDSLSLRGQDTGEDAGMMEEVDEVQDILTIHSLIAQNLGEVRAILVSKGFRQQVLEVEGCINGEDPREVTITDAKAKVAKESEIRREEGLWDAPSDDDHEEEDSVPVFQGKVETSRPSEAPPEEADFMPDTAPVRPELNAGSAFEVRERASPQKAFPSKTQHSAAIDDVEVEEQLIRTRRRYTQAKPISSTEGESAEEAFSTPVGPEVSQQPSVMPKLNKQSQLARDDDSGPQDEDIPAAPQSKTNGASAADPGPSEQNEEVSAFRLPQKATGRLYGVGAVFKRSSDGFFYVKKVVPSGPAGRAGVEVGARVLAVDGEKLYQKTSTYLYKLVLGSEGTSVALQLQARGASVNSAVTQITVRRAFIDDSHLEYSSSEETNASHGAVPKSPSKILDKLKQPSGLVPRSPATKGVSEGSDLEKVGIGITFKRDADGFFFVKKIAPGGAAEAAGGIFVDDKILEIDGQDMHRKTNQDLTKAVLGPVGTKLTLLIKEREGEVKTIAVTRIRGGEEMPSSQTSLGEESPQAAQNKLQSGMVGTQGTSSQHSDNVVQFPSETGGMAGPGFRVSSRADGEYIVKDFVVGTATQAGSILVGDIIIEIDGVSLTGKSAAALQALLFGPEGSNMEIVISRSPGVTRKVFRMRRVLHPSEPISSATHVESGGVGIMFRSDEENGTFSVKKVAPHGPAAMSGLVTIGDQLVEIDGVGVHGLSSKRVVESINGPAGTLVELVIRKAAPDGSLVSVKLVRAKGTLDLDHTSDAHHAGIGVTLKRDGEGFFFIKKIVEGSPAQVVGNLEVGDSIREVDGSSLFRQNYSQVSSLLHGAENTVVTLGVWDADNQTMRQVPIPRTADAESEENGSDSA